MCLSLVRFFGAIESTGTGFSVGNSYVRMLVEVSKEIALADSAECKREQVLVDKSHIRDEHTRMAFLNSGLISAGCGSILRDYSRAGNKIRISCTEDCQTHEQRVYVCHYFPALRHMLSSFVLGRGEGDEGEKI